MANNNEGKATKPSVLYEGHRDRMRQRFLDYGMDHMQDTELLEILMFYSIPRKDTKEVAHELVQSFGSISGVMNADIDELTKVPGVTYNSAVLIRLALVLARKYAIDSHEDLPVYNTIDKIGQYVKRLYIGVNVERVYLLLFDNALRMIDCCWISDGSVNSAIPKTRVMIEKAYQKQAASVILVHNHPHGIAVPSGDDIAMTHRLDSAFDLVGIKLLEHIVVAGDKYAPILLKGTDMFRIANM